MLTVLVTGANRGIGLGLTRHLLADPSVDIVIATARDVDSAKDLKALNSSKLYIIELNVADEKSIDKAAIKVSEIVGENGLDVLINNAGICYVESLDGDVSKEKMTEQLDVNVVAPLLISNRFFPFLKKAAAKNGSAQIANISSRIGSLTNAHSHKMPITMYGISKSALNMLTRRLATEWAGVHIRATCFCPGWVKTDMGSQMAALTVDESTGPLTKLIRSLTEEHNGKFLNTSGEPIPW
ncbi:hypothetical protein PMAYCL1PPCAC_32740 [Pristionchus mayeri]|uniref:Dehydrogenase n=1 Tax=Pristionchus mayeri TaxID=1317129 RepID=A0AAN5DHX4_9BILA|nr:hypothetical protein PMAYCL1PPCAC_32740 [Pristionchus mayeri]